MYEYEIQNKLTNEWTYIYGTSYERACEGSNIDTTIWEYVDANYID